MNYTSLEPLLPGHASEMYQGLQSHEIYQYIDERAPVSEQALRGRYERLALRRSPDGRDIWLNWIVRASAEPSIVGYVQATIGMSNVCEIAYVIFPVVWGRGYGRSAVANMLELLSQTFGPMRFVARVEAQNIRSVSLLSSLGFARRNETADLHRGDSEQIYELSRSSVNTVDRL